MSSELRRKRSYPTLAAWRESWGLSQAEAARLLAISQTRYSRLERGTQPASGKLAKRVRHLTGVPLDILVGAA